MASLFLFLWVVVKLVFLFVGIGVAVALLLLPILLFNVFRMKHPDPFVLAFRHHASNTFAIDPLAFIPHRTTQTERATVLKTSERLHANLDSPNRKAIADMVSLYLFNYVRQKNVVNHYLAEQRRKTVRPVEFLVKTVRLFVRKRSTASEDALEAMVWYPFAQGKCYVTEWPFYFLAPRTRETERRLEDIIAETEEQVCS